MPTVVVLGANSFAGAAFVDLLLRETDYRVIGITRGGTLPQAFWYPWTDEQVKRSRFWRGYHLNTAMHHLLVLLDNTRPEMLVNFVAQSEVAPSWEHPEDWFQTNTVALARLVNHLRKQKYLQRYLHVSSPEVYGSTSATVRDDAPLNPSTPYAASKAAADLLLAVYHKQYGFPLLTVRPTNYFGARQQLFKLIPRCCLALKAGQQIPLHGGGQAVKSYLHVQDAARGMLAVLERGRLGECYHLSPDRGRKVCDVVDTLAGYYGKTLLEVAENVPERPGQDACYVIDSSKARTELGWEPQVDFYQGVLKVVDWVDQHYEALKSLPREYVHRA